MCHIFQTPNSITVFTIQPFVGLLPSHNVFPIDDQKKNTFYINCTKQGFFKYINCTTQGGLKKQNCTTLGGLKKQNCTTKGFFFFYKKKVCSFFNILLAAPSKQCFYKMLISNVCFVRDFGLFSLQIHLTCSGKNIIRNL